MARKECPVKKFCPMGGEYCRTCEFNPNKKQKRKTMGALKKGR